MSRCGHQATTADGQPLVCGLAAKHRGLHEQKTKLRDGDVRTNWGDDGLASWATKDAARLEASQKGQR